MRNFKDESFIAQYLSPKLIRDFRLFAVADHAGEAELEVDSIHDEHGYRRVRQLLAAAPLRRESFPTSRSRTTSATATARSRCATRCCAGVRSPTTRRTRC